VPVFTEDIEKMLLKSVRIACVSNETRNGYSHNKISKLPYLSVSGLGPDLKTSFALGRWKFRYRWVSEEANMTRNWGVLIRPVSHL
jgi:hypothetical protein